MGKGLMERFEQKFVPEPNTGCWIWTAAVKRTPSQDYLLPWFYLDKSPTSGARASWVIYKGEDPKNKHVLHKCHNSLCVNPDHLYLGTHSENMRDKKIASRARGSNGATDLSVVRKIKGADQARSSKSVAVEFGVSPTTVQRIRNSARWAHV